MTKFIVILLAMMILSSCNQQVEEDGLELSSTEYKEQIAELVEKLKVREDTIVKLEDRIERREDELEYMVNAVDELTKPANDDVYSKGFNELKNENLARTMRIIDSIYLRNHPYAGAAAIRRSMNQPWLMKGIDIIVHAAVRNEDGETWALVEHPDLASYSNNFGYVPFESLQEVEHSAPMRDDTESIAGIRVGDIFEKAVVAWGTEYSKWNGPNAMGYTFVEFEVGVDLDPIRNSINNISVREPGFYTNEGVQIGDNAVETLSLYANKYEQNTDEKLYDEHSEYIFKLNEDNYVIEFWIDTEELTEQSVIARMWLYNIYGLSEW